MSASGPSKYCPRCNTQLPAQAMFCGSCGYQFAPSGPAAQQGASSGSNYGPPSYQGQSAGWAPTQSAYPPQSQPGYSPQGQPGYPPPMQPAYPPQGQPAYPPQMQPAYGVPLAPGGTPQKSGGAGKFIMIALVVVVLLGGGAAAWFLYLNPGRCSGPLFDSHGVPSSVPLPSGCAFDAHPASQSSTGSQGGKTTSDQWLWSVNGNDQTGVQTFYQDNLSGKGWTNVKPANSKDGKGVIACQGNQLLLISTGQQGRVKNSDGTTSNFTAPSGGTLLAISIVTAGDAQAQLGIQFLCTGKIPTLPTP
jgi:hypothetical protein